MKTRRTRSSIVKVRDHAARIKRTYACLIDLIREAPEGVCATEDAWYAVASQEDGTKVIEVETGDSSFIWVVDAAGNLEGGSRYTTPIANRLARTSFVQNQEDGSLTQVHRVKWSGSGTGCYAEEHQLRHDGSVVRYAGVQVEPCIEIAADSPS